MEDPTLRIPWFRAEGFATRRPFHRTRETRIRSTGATGRPAFIQRATLTGYWIRQENFTLGVKRSRTRCKEESQ